MLNLVLFTLCFCSANSREFKVKVDLSTPYITNLPVKQSLNSGVLLRTSIVGSTSLSTNSSLLERAQETGNLHLTAIYQGYHNHWSLDLVVGESAGDKFLCTNHLVEKQSDHNVTVGVFSTRQKPVYVQIQAVHEDINIELDSEKEFEMNQHSSRVFSFFPNLELYSYAEEEDETYLVTVKSMLNESSNCVYVAINQPGCPWIDSEDIVRNSGMWARMLSVGFYPVRTKMFPKGFIISVIPVFNSSECRTLPLKFNTSFVNTMSIKIEKTLNSYSLPIGSAVGVVTAIGVLVLFFVVAVWKANMEPYNEVYEGNEVVELNGNGEDEYRRAGNAALKTRGSVESEVGPENAYRKVLVSDMRAILKDRPGHKSEHLQHAIDRIAEKDLRLVDLLKLSENPWHRRQRSKTYLLLTPLLSIFYLVPSAQMVYMELIRSSGNLEQCYLNYGCSRPHGIFTDFNHIVSNSGYWIYGIIFIILVFIKSKLLPEGHKTHEDHSVNSTGPLQQHSLFYTMGICLILQGLFSAIFHICPSNISLQFDTTMMNMMMILVFIKIFQLRHADTAYNAFHVMYVFAVVLVFEAVSLYVFNTAWRLVLYVLFVFCYVLLMIHMGVDIYYYGAVKTSIRKMVPVMVKHALRYKEECLNTKKFILTSVFFLINTFLLSFIVYRASQDPGRSLSTPLLFIGGTNVGMYLVYYFVNKLQEICYDEELEQDSTTPTKFMRGLSFIFFLTALVIGVIAGVFYYMKHQSRNSTPPESRNKNELCNLMDFYDNHDLWHFFSGTALFFALVGLLIIDDDLLFIDRGRIRVF